jgi:hypothetical protein
MPNELIPKVIHCPYCGETIEILVDCSIAEQDYIEDCQVCCQPINFSVTVNDPENISLQVNRDDE